ncbi:MAG: hypothetical protein MSH08_00140 [Ezakiella sp.]|nr:hypothetical protein [Ezakiella sp.]MCI6994974.1 hypothetical protein [Methanobrevibacter sp.]
MVTSESIEEFALFCSTKTKSELLEMKQELEERMAKMELDETIIPKLAVVDAILEVSNG